MDIKPGRGKSFFTGVQTAGSVLFGIGWLYFANSIDAPLIFLLLGVIVILYGLFETWFHFHNAFSRNRFDVLQLRKSGEEPDPFSNRIMQGSNSGSYTKRKYPGSHCPFCGVEVKNDFDYCPGCGKDI